MNSLEPGAPSCPLHMPPTWSAWQMLGFLDVLRDSPARKGCIPNTPGKEASSSLNLASLPELVLSRALWGGGGSVTHRFELANGPRSATYWLGSLVQVTFPL